ncbi:putative ribonuclease H-like domain-containing protein [Tanacetum coccineum]
MVPRAVLMKTGLKTVDNARPVNTVRSVNTGRPFSTARSFNTVRPSYTAHPKSTVCCVRPRTYFQNQAQSTVQRPFYKRTTLTKRSYNQNVNTVRQNVNTVMAKGFNVVKPSTCWVWRPIKPNGANQLLDAQGTCLGNKVPSLDFKDFDGGYVTFGGGANGGELLAKEEPKRVSKALSDPAWVEAMQDELLQFKLQKVWVLADLPKGHRAIGTKWVYRNKKDERGFFEDPDHPDKVYKVVKALYGLHQAPRAWYDTLATYLLSNGFQRGQIDQTLFVKSLTRKKGIFIKSRYICPMKFDKVSTTQIEVSLYSYYILEKPLVSRWNADDGLMNIFIELMIVDL